MRTGVRTRRLRVEAEDGGGDEGGSDRYSLRSDSPLPSP
jgi:hypothetical protein